MELKLPYGLKDNKLISIDEVESGLACGCICPACEKPLVARKGKFKQYHFAHYNAPDCNGGLETAMHIQAKNWIAQSETFTTPFLLYPNTPHLIFPETPIPVDKVWLEKRLDGIIPDVIIQSKGKLLLVEIVVNNPVSWEKARKIREQSLAAIEIDVKHLFRSLYHKQNFALADDGFRKELVNGTSCKSWLHNPKLRKVQNKLKEDYAEVKKVESFKIGEMGYFNYVNDCPLQKKTFRGGRNKGKPYATIDHDCESCAYCSGVDYKIVRSRKFFDREYYIPQRVYCLGGLKRDFPALLGGLRR